MKVTIAPLAQGDLPEIKDFISRDNPARAASFVSELIASCRKLGRMPRAFPSAGLPRDLSVRKRQHGAYIIYYRIRNGEVQVLRNVHGARDQRQLL